MAGLDRVDVRGLLPHMLGLLAQAHALTGELARGHRGSFAMSR